MTELYPFLHMELCGSIAFNQKTVITEFRITDGHMPRKSRASPAGSTAIRLETYYTQDLTFCAQRAGPRSVQGHIERGYPG